MTDQATVPTVALIDVAGIFRANFATTEDRTALVRTVEKVRQLRAGFDYCAVCLDSPPYRRSQISPEYKAQRAKPPAGMYEIYEQTKRQIADDGIAVLAAEGYEADDVIATLTAQLVERPADRRVAVVVVSADKDLLQLVDDKSLVSCLNWSTGKAFDESGVCDEFKVAPSGICDLLALAGDSSDNIMGVKSVGRITAAMVVNSGPGLEGALAGEFIRGITPRTAHAIAEAREAVLLAKRLVTLEFEAPVSADEIFVKREPKPAPVQEAPRAKPVAVAPVSATQIVPRTEGPRAASAPDSDWSVGVSLESLVARVEKIREVHKHVMKEGHHYGVVPGTSSKPSLFKPGAELLTLLFQLDPQFSSADQYTGDHLESVVTCTLYHAPTGTRVGSGVGSCSTRESKYAWRQGERLCPLCKKPAIIKGREEYGGGWVCFTRKNGCNAKFEDRDTRITQQNVGRVANPDLPDNYNTVRKMGCKRAHVAAILFVTGASEIFTQDVEDNADPNDADDAQSRPAQQQRQRGAA